MNRRFAAIIAGVVVLLVAVALVIARRDTAHAPSRLPIALGAAHSGGAADAALAPYGGIVYHLGRGVPLLDAPARAYRVAAADPTTAARRLATALGLPGEPKADGDTVTVTDGARQLVVTNRDWSYNSEPNGAVSSSPTSQPALTDLLPTEDEAKAAALDVLHRAGIDTRGAAVSTDLGADQWFVKVDPVVDGVATEGFGAAVIIGDKGAIDAASGVLGAVAAADQYPLAGTKVAIDRLNAGEGSVGPQPLEAQAMPAPASAAPPAGSDEPAASDEPPASDAAISEGEASAAPPSPPDSASPLPPDSEKPPTDTPPTDTIPPPAPQDVTLTGAERILVFVTSTDGTSWLVPAYRFTTPDGSGPTVIAVADRFLLAGDVPPTGR